MPRDDETDKEKSAVNLVIGTTKGTNAVRIPLRSFVVVPKRNPKETAMRFLVTIYIDEKEENRYTPADWARLDTGYAHFSKTAREKGYQVEGGALKPPSQAKTLRVRHGQVLITDGPFAETKEQMGGYFLIDCPSLEDVISVARLMPGAMSNCVEIRAQEPEKASV